MPLRIFFCNWYFVGFHSPLFPSLFRMKPFKRQAFSRFPITPECLHPGYNPNFAGYGRFPQSFLWLFPIIITEKTPLENSRYGLFLTILVFFEENGVPLFFRSLPGEGKA